MIVNATSGGNQWGGLSCENDTNIEKQKNARFMNLKSPGDTADALHLPSLPQSVWAWVCGLVVMWARGFVVVGSGSWLWVVTVFILFPLLRLGFHD